MHPLQAAHLLAWSKETLYRRLRVSQSSLEGKPPAANMLVADYLRVEARKAGVSFQANDTLLTFLESL
jgi:hypothetical protein